MTYDRQELLKMLSVVPFYDGMEFHEGKNNEFFNYMGNDFFNLYYYAYGATKLALIPLNKEKDYVIKIPYTGSYNHEYGYYDNYSNYYPERVDYWEYCAAENEERVWDYCACEVERYNTALTEGFAEYFAKTELLGFINNYPIYVQERCTTFSDIDHKHNKEEKIKTLNCCKYYGINQDWLTDFRLYYGEEQLLNFIDFISLLGWDDDLRNENIGYIKNRPVLIDYSGFYE